MNPAAEVFVHLLPISAIISVVYSAMKEETPGTIAWTAAKFFLKMYLGVVLFSAAVFGLCWLLR